MSSFSRHPFFRLTALTRELDHLETEDEQRAVWKVVSERMWTRGYLHKRALWVLAIAVATLILVFWNRLNAVTPVGAGKSTLNEWYFWYLAMVFISYLSYWLMRSQYQRVRFETEAEQRAALLTVAERVKRRKSARWGTLFVIVLALAAMILARPAGAALGLYGLMPRWLYEVLSNGSVAILTVFGLLWFSRRRFSRGIRGYLIEREMPICLNCGYDLTGTRESRCPECGEAADRHAEAPN